MPSKQALTDFLWGIVITLGVAAGLGFLGLLSYWLQWDGEINYPIQHAPIVQPKFVRV